MSIDEQIDLLNELIETTIDSVDGYEQAAEVASDPDLAGTFRRFAAERREALDRLRAEVRALGGEPEDDGSVLAAAHRLFLNLRTAVQDDTQAAIAEVERGEDYITAQYEGALNSDLLAPSVRAAIAAGYETVRRGHDTVADMKRAWRPY